jgi:hypothetical protein
VTTPTTTRPRDETPAGIASRDNASHLGGVTHPAGGFRHPHPGAQEGNVTTPQPPPGPAVPARSRPLVVWPLLLLAMPAFVAVWAGWVGLGTMTGFGEINPLPGTPARDWTVDTAITLPIGAETYAAYALYVWLSGRAATTAARFAKWSAIGSLLLGAAGQTTYHLMSAAKVTHAPWQITAVVSCLPVAVLGMGAALAHLVREDTPAPVPSSPSAGPSADAVPVASSPTTEATPVAPTAETQAAPTERPRRTATRPAGTGKTSAGTDTAARVARLRVKRPDITQAEAARELKVAERTVRRYWPTTTPTAQAPTVLPATDPDGPAPTTPLPTTDPTTQIDTEPGDDESQAA